MRPNSPPWPLLDPDAALPVEWWGGVGAPRSNFTLAELVDNGTLTAESNRLLGQLVASGKSLLIASQRAGAGKTTLLTALLSRLQPTRHRFFVRGSYETYPFLGAATPGNSTLLVNEISPHMPIYCWGESLRQMLNAHSSGYQILSTIHADSANDVRLLLQSFVPSGGELECGRECSVAFLSVREEGDRVCRFVHSIVAMAVDDRGGEFGDRLIYQRQLDQVTPPVEHKMDIEVIPRPIE